MHNNMEYSDTADTTSVAVSGAADTVNSSSDKRAAPCWVSTLGTGVLFALAGLLSGFRTIAKATLPHILLPEQGISFQQTTDRIPTPRLLNWNIDQIYRMVDISSVQGASLLLLYAAMFLLLLLLTAQVFNRAFRPIHFKHAGLRGILEGAIETHYPLQSILLLTTTMLVAWLIWKVVPVHIPPSPAGTIASARMGYAWLIRLTALGVLLWLFWGEHGAADVWMHGRERWSAGKSLALVLRGFLWGVLTYLAAYISMPASLEPLLTKLHALGPFNRILFGDVEHHYLAGAAAVWFTAGCLAALLSRNNLPSRWLAALPLAGMGAGMVAFQWFSPTHLVKRYDLSPNVLAAIAFPYSRDHPSTGIPDGRLAARALAKKIHLTFGSRAAYPKRDVLVFRQYGPPVVVIQHGYTLDGLSADRASMANTKKFLEKKRYLSALGWIAFKHLFDCYAMRMEVSRTLNLTLEDLSYGPFATQCDEVVQTMFYTCAANKENQKLLDKWADPHRFAHPDRFSMRLIGDLYRRFGDKSKELFWYRRAEMPSSFMQHAEAEKPMFNTGSVSGRLMWNGKPLAGVKVGVIPWRMNGIPAWVALALQNNIYQIYSPRPYSRLFGPFQPSPFAFHWVSASDTTDSSGSFHIDHLTEGQYRVLLILPPDYTLHVPFDRQLQVRNAPSPFVVKYSAPSVNLGTAYMNWDNSPVQKEQKKTKSGMLH